MKDIKRKPLKKSKIPQIWLQRARQHVLKLGQQISTLDLKESIEVEVILRYNPSGKGLPSIKDFDATPPQRRKHLSHQEFNASYAASPGDIAKVEEFAKRHNLNVVRINPAHRAVILKGSIESFNEAFNVKMLNFQHPEKGNFRAYDGEIYIPEELEGIIDSVFGLQNIPIATPYFRLFKKDTRLHAEGTASESSFEGKFYPTQLAQIYDFPSDVSGQGQSIAIIEFGGGYEIDNLKNYFENVLKIPMPNISDVYVNGAKNVPYTISQGDGSKSYSSFNTEVYMDIEVAGAVAPGADIFVYFAPNTDKDFVAVLKQAVHDDSKNHAVISLSWGKEESSWVEASITAINETLNEAAALGIIVCVSSGDLGAGDASWNPGGLAEVDFPASSPFALGCGGTRLVAEEMQLKEEVGWNNKYGASGGGASSIFACPEYQTNIGVCPHSVNPGASTGRGVPDTAANSDPETGYILQVNDTLITSGGDSAVAPLYAGLVALLNQKLNANLGFLNPFLYQNATSKELFNDIITGNNSFGIIKGYTAEKGWDACTGWGSLNGQRLLKALQEG